MPAPIRYNGRNPRKQDTDLPARRPDVRGPNGHVQDQSWHSNKRRWRRLVAMTCSTDGCPNKGRVWEDRVDDNPDGIDRVQCGLCGEWIEVMTDHPTKHGFTHARFEQVHGRHWDAYMDEPWDDPDGTL